MTQDDINKIYRDSPLEKIPWIYDTPPAILIELVNKGIVKPCRTLDLGCGIGNYSIYLATKGFTVTGIDISTVAIEIAKKNAKEKNARCKFFASNLLGDLSDVGYNYEFAYDWELFHHIPPEKRQIYVENVFKLLKTNGRYMSVSFSEKDPYFGGQGKIRKTPIGTTLHFSSEIEMKELFEPYFEIDELKTIQIRGKPTPHLAIYAFMRRKKEEY